jgi:hypothetical protein
MSNTAPNSRLPEYNCIVQLCNPGPAVLDLDLWRRASRQTSKVIANKSFFENTILHEKKN